MYKLLIADRDNNERTGLNWLVSSFPTPFHQVFHASSVEELIEITENKLPDIVIVELDMIPNKLWDTYKKISERYGQEIIAMTMEATFDRATQAIELGAQDFWLKPNSPTQIKRTLQKCIHNLKKKKMNKPEENHNQPHVLSYHSLFLENEVEGKDYHLMMLQTENRNEINHLLSFLEAYEFQCKPILFPMSDCLICVFTNGGDVLKQDAHRILRTWEEIEHDPIAIVINDDASIGLSLNGKYLQTRKAMELTFFKGYRQILHVESVSRWIPIDVFLTPSEIRTWIEMLNNASKDKIRIWMYNEFLNLTEPFPEPGLLRSRMTSLLAQIHRFMKTYNLGNERIMNLYHQLFTTILYGPVLNRIVQEMLLFIYEIIQEVNKQTDLNRIDVIEKGIMYLENHFGNQELSLDKVAEYVNRSPAYLSHLFSRKHGTSFRKILTNIRIKEAQCYLTETNMSIQEIAERTGFTTSSYFGKIFKEVAGTTPREFRTSKDQSIS
ncbi:helix-turn-helix domain-containing protein [Peribacillus butanolivorans]|uniref:helix-turn-helix domain-containing protein n=1 Tax=Peribacillus butanolivorans TaxID=421767 RepID=UPI0030C931C1